MRRPGMIMAGILMAILTFAMVFMPHMIKKKRIDTQTLEFSRGINSSVDSVLRGWSSYTAKRDRGEDCSSVWLGRVDSTWLSAKNYVWSGDFKSMFPDYFENDDFTMEVMPVINVATGDPKTIKISSDVYPSEMLVRLILSKDEFVQFSREELKGLKKRENVMIDVRSDDLYIDFLLK